MTSNENSVLPLWIPGKETILIDVKETLLSSRGTYIPQPCSPINVDSSLIKTPNLLSLVLMIEYKFLTLFLPTHERSTSLNYKTPGDEGPKTFR